MLKVFHLSNKPPFPLKDGGCVAISGLLKSLLVTPKIEVFHFTIATQKHPFRIEEYPEKWKERMVVESKYINTKTTIRGAITHLIKNKSYNVSRFDDKDVAESIQEYLEGVEFDVAIFESIYLLPYLHLFQEKGIKVIVRTHNVEYKIWSGMGKNTKSPLKKWYYKKLAKQLEDYELSELAKVDGIVAITDEDAEFFKGKFPEKKIASISTAINTNQPLPDYNLSDFFFLGAMDWKPNREGIEWLYKEVIPNGLEKSQLHIAGKGLKKNKFNHPTVVVEGEVKSALNFINQHGICLIPLRSGSGVKIKLLENMALGKPIVTTTEGVRGVDVEHGKEVLIADNPAEFREFMYKLHADKVLRKKLGTNAKKFVQKHFGETKLTQELIAFIKDI